ncbi:hypothetical protein MESS2_80093 [Mesorhizobium metallidurans STM 2683]|uniref:Uncharacterized protein n=1 Tax=Mesorhizobium metallidurans STM 2683 TaxID=1297569 RepID=M5EXP0_9HYPH|nr:hypothetical protein MESS2_80093 [Mesorhizobium metallidurans STM 2683]
MRTSRSDFDFCLDAIPKGKRYELFPGKPFHTFPGIALTKQISLTGTVIGAPVLSTGLASKQRCAIATFGEKRPRPNSGKTGQSITQGLLQRLRYCIGNEYVHLE